MPKQPQDNSNGMMDARSSFNTGLWAVNVLSAMLFPFIRSGQGVRSPGLAGFLAFLAIPLYATATHADEIVTFWYAWMLASAVRKLCPDRRQHTQYAGWPWLAAWLTLGTLSETALRFLEPFIVLGIAYFLAGHSAPLAKLIGAAGLALAISNRIGFELRQRHLEAVHDAKLEAGLYR